MTRRPRIVYFVDFMNEDYPVVQVSGNKRTYNKVYLNFRAAKRGVESYYQANKNVERGSVFLYRTIGQIMLKSWMV